MNIWHSAIGWDSLHHYGGRLMVYESWIIQIILVIIIASLIQKLK